MTNEKGSHFYIFNDELMTLIRRYRRVKYYKSNVRDTNFLQ